MQNLLYALIVLFGTASYGVGVYQMLRGEYAPSLFSRSVWLLLAMNSFAGVLFSNHSTSSLLLAGIFLAGNIAMTITSYYKGTKSFGQLEQVCIILLVVSGMVWLLFDAPVINLSISLFAHFIGGVPTLRRVWRKPGSENTAFWALFFMASVLSVHASDTMSLEAIIFPLYYVIFDGGMTILSLRNRVAGTRKLGTI